MCGATESDGSTGGGYGMAFGRWAAGSGDGGHLGGGRATGVLMMVADLFGAFLFLVVFMRVRRRGE